MSGSSRQLTLKKGAPGEQVGAANQLPGKESTDVDDVPVPARK